MFGDDISLWSWMHVSTNLCSMFVMFCVSSSTVFNIWWAAVPCRSKKVFINQKKRRKAEKSKYTSLNRSAQNTHKHAAKQTHEMLCWCSVLISFKCILCVWFVIHFSLCVFFCSFSKLISHDIQMFEFKLDILMVIHVKCNETERKPIDKWRTHRDICSTPDQPTSYSTQRATVCKCKTNRRQQQTIKILMMLRIKLF